MLSFHLYGSPKELCTPKTLFKAKIKSKLKTAILTDGYNPNIGKNRL